MKTWEGNVFWKKENGCSLRKKIKQNWISNSHTNESISIGLEKQNFKCRKVAGEQWYAFTTLVIESLFEHQKQPGKPNSSNER